MADPATNLTELEALAKSPAWTLVLEVLTAQMNKALIPPSITPNMPMDEIARIAIHQAAAYQTLAWIADKGPKGMLGEMIARERKALNE